MAGSADPKEPEKEKQKEEQAYQVSKAAPHLAIASDFSAFNISLLKGGLDAIAEDSFYANRRAAAWAGGSLGADLAPTFLARLKGHAAPFDVFPHTSVAPVHSADNAAAHLERNGRPR